MSADADLHYSRKPFLLTLKGKVTVQYMDGQTLEGEIAAQDELNIWLIVDGSPHLISRSQIRYIKGKPEQSIEAETAQESLLAATPSLADTSPGVSKIEPEPVAVPAQFVEEPEPVAEPAQFVEEPEPVAMPAQFVEEPEVAPPDEDNGGTLIIPPGLAQPAPALDQTNLHAPVEDESGDVGTTAILSPESEVTPAWAEPVLSATDLGETELLPSLEEADSDATFVLRPTEGEEISAHLVCTTGPHAGEVLKLKPGVVTIGRSSDNALSLAKDKEVSRRHTIIVYEASKFVVQDQNSLNGTFVNDQLIKEPRPLQDGDVLLIGVSTLKFQESPKK